MALEEYIRQVREIWTSYPLDLVNYQNKCRLIRYVLHLMQELLLTHACTEDGTIYLQSVVRISIL